MNDVITPIKIGDTVKVKTPPTMGASANAVTFERWRDLSSLFILDGRVGQVTQMKNDGNDNVAVVVEIDGRHHVLWLWQVEKLENL